MHRRLNKDKQVCVMWHCDGMWSLRKKKRKCDLLVKAAGLLITQRKKGLNPFIFYKDKLL